MKITEQMHGLIKNSFIWNIWIWNRITEKSLWRNNTYSYRHNCLNLLLK